MINFSRNGPETTGYPHAKISKLNNPTLLGLPLQSSG